MIAISLWKTPVEETEMFYRDSIHSFILGDARAFISINQGIVAVDENLNQSIDDSIGYI